MSWGFVVTENCDSGYEQREYWFEFVIDKSQLQVNLWRMKVLKRTDRRRRFDYVKIWTESPEAIARIPAHVERIANKPKVPLGVKRTMLKYLEDSTKCNFDIKVDSVMVEASQAFH